MLGTKLLSSIFCGSCFCHASFSCTRWQPVGKAIVRTFCSNVPDRPKQPLRPYVRFVKHCSAEFPEKIQREAALHGVKPRNVLAKAWHDLPEEDKMVYKEAFMRDYLEYKPLVRHWWSDLSEEQKSVFLDNKKVRSKTKLSFLQNKKMRELGKPTKPPGPIITFCIQQNNYSIDNSNKKASFQHNLDLWNSMSAEEKQPFIDQDKENFKVYHIKKHVWQLQMMKQGYGELIIQRRNKWKKAEWNKGNQTYKISDE